MTHPDTDTDDPTSEAEERPERQCVAIADETGERCQNVPIPGVDRCHTHIDYAELAEAIDDEPMTATAPEDGSETPPLRHGTPGSGRDKKATPATRTGAQTTETAKSGGSAAQKMENVSK